MKRANKYILPGLLLAISVLGIFITIEITAATGILELYLMAALFGLGAVICFVAIVERATGVTNE
jgi:hypothetical protein